MASIEEYLITEKFVKDDEHFIYADLGLEVDENDNVSIDIGLEEYIEYKPQSELPFDE